MPDAHGQATPAERARLPTDMDPKVRWATPLQFWESVRGTFGDPEKPAPNYLDHIRRLVESRVFDVDWWNRTGETALMVATTAGYLDHVQLLLELGADINAQDNRGHGVLHRCARMCGNVYHTHDPYPEIFAYLLTHGADPTLLSCLDETPSMCAIGKGREAVLRIYMKHGVREGVPQYEGKSEAEATKRPPHMPAYCDHMRDHPMYHRKIDPELLARTRSVVPPRVGEPGTTHIYPYF